MYMEKQKQYKAMTTAREFLNSLPALMPTDADGLVRLAIASDMYDPTDPAYIADIPYTMKILALDNLNAILRSSGTQSWQCLLRRPALRCREQLCATHCPPQSRFPLHAGNVF